MADSLILTNEAIKRQISSIFADFVSDVDPDHLSDYLIQDAVVTIDQWQKIRSENATPKMRCRALLYHLQSISHPRAFLVVRRVLEKDYHHLLEKITNDSAHKADGKTCQLLANGTQLEVLPQELENEQLEQRIQEIEARWKSRFDEEKDRWKEEKEQLEQLVFQLKLNQSKPDDDRKADGLTAEVNDVSSKASILKGTHLIVRLDLSYSAVFGVTKLKQRLYVLCQSPNSVYVYEDGNPFRLKKEVRLKESKYPRDLGSSEVSNCLYVTDLGRHCIWKMTADDYRVTKWLSGVDGVLTLSVSIEGHVLVVRKVEQSNLLETYGWDASLHHSQTLSADIQRPLHAIQSCTGHLFISHRSCNAWKGNWVITRLDKDGQFVDRLNRGNGFSDLQSPWHLALNLTNDRLFVADLWKNRVIVSDIRTSTWSEVLLTERNGLQCPWRLHYDGKKKQLVVGQLIGKVDVYEINEECLKS